MARWKNMSKRLAVLTMMGAMMLGSATTAFAQSNENAETTQQEETTESTQSESTDTSDLVLEETDTTEEDFGEGIDRGDAFSVPGNAQVLDDITDGTTKEFLTIVTKNNQTFYVIIDRSSTTDNVYMLSNIDEDDLQEFLKEASADKEEEKPAVILPEKTVMEDEPAAPETESDKKETESDQAKNAGMGLILVAAVGALAAAYYFKIYKPKQNVDEDTDNEGLEDAEDYEEVDEDNE